MKSFNLERALLSRNNFEGDLVTPKKSYYMNVFKLRDEDGYYGTIMTDSYEESVKNIGNANTNGYVTTVKIEF